MARQEQDREDLMREATGLSPRAEIRSPHLDENLIFGFRRQGGLSLYFGPDPVYQFNSAGEFRRGYLGGKLLKAENGRIAAMTRDRSGEEVTLWREDWTDEQIAIYVKELAERCELLRKLLETGEYELLSEVPSEAGAVERLKRFLEALPSPPRIAQRPNSG